MIGLQGMCQSDLERAKKDGEEARLGWAGTESELEESLAKELVSRKALAEKKLALSDCQAKPKPRPSKQGGASDGGAVAAEASGDNDKKRLERKLDELMAKLVESEAKLAAGNGGGGGVGAAVSAFVAGLAVAGVALKVILH